MEMLTISERIARTMMNMSRDEIAVVRNKPKETIRPVVEKKVTVNPISLERIDGLPQLEVVAKNAKTDDIIAHINIKLCAMILSPTNQVLYLEAIATSASAAHAIMGAVSDTRGSVQDWWLYRTAGRDVLMPPQNGHCADLRLDVQGWRGQLHHVAIVDRSGSLLLSHDDTLLWGKLRQRMTCPTLDHWGVSMMPQIMQSEMLLPCESFGIPAHYKPYVLADDAEKIFDTLVCQHVERVGIKECAA